VLQIQVVSKIIYRDGSIKITRCTVRRGGVDTTRCDPGLAQFASPTYVRDTGHTSIYCHGSYYSQL
jgi:hypothetical protein